MVDVHRRLKWIARTVAAGFMVALFLTRKLWLSTRLFPLTPVTDVLPQIPPPIDYLVYGAFFALGAAVIVSRNPRRSLVTITLLYLVYSLFDQQRWSPYFPEMAALFAVLSANHWHLREDERARDVLLTCGLVIASMYFWSGLQNVNHAFYMDIFPRLMSPFSAMIPSVLESRLVYLGALVPFAQVFVGVALLVRRLRTAGIALGMSMHAFVLVAVGLLMWRGSAATGAITGSTEIWSWNVVAIALLPLVFRGNDSPPSAFFTVPLAVNKLMIILFGIMPLFNLVSVPWLGRLDDFQATSVYAGNSSRARVHLPRSEARKVPYPLRPLLSEQDHGDELVLDLTDWAQRDLAVPLYGARRIEENAARALCRSMIDPRSVYVRLAGKAGLVTGERRHVDIPCKAL